MSYVNFMKLEIQKVLYLSDLNIEKGSIDKEYGR